MAITCHRCGRQYDVTLFQFGRRVECTCGATVDLSRGHLLMTDSDSSKERTSWFPRHKVLVPIDFSKASLAAVDVGLSLVDDPSHLYVLHVTPAVVKGDPGFPWNPLEETTQRARITAAVQERLADAIRRGVQTEVAFGDPGTEIARFAEEGGFDLIVMPSHGRTGLTRLLIGSVTERVTRLAHCPVLVERTSAASERP
jgi:nucleotide-binding universal stress UspA family protein